ncbi:hypothetical protein K1719_014973 [Acacia pycnantha]|nr:hypothetical protein K1719_045936 [Acacia pycnantha]KAI9113722.1 hypothetical protein K1719_014973 [Acacia pycnantha]
MPQMEAISLSSKGLDGEVPVSFNRFVSLTDLSVSSSGLRNISSALNILHRCRNLSTLILTNNFLNEEMRQDLIIELKSLEVLVLSNSQIKGLVPQWLRGCKMLLFVDLSWNSLSGSIPSWFDSIRTGDTQTRQPNRLEYPSLSRLHSSLVLSYNKLEGSIWAGFENLKGLHVMDLKHNRLSGVVPDGLSEMTVMETIDLSHNRLSGGYQLKHGTLSIFWSCSS